MTPKSNDKQQYNGQLETINLFDYVNVLVKWKRFIGWNLLIIVVLTAGITLLMPNVYKSTVTLLPPKQRGTSSSLLQLTREFLPTTSLGRLNVGQETYNYLAILKSRTAMERVVEKFNLFEVYDIKPGLMERAVKMLEDNVEFEIQDEGTVTIEVWDTDRERAAAMANYFAEVLNQISIQLGTQEARNNREFIEQRYETIRRELKAAEDSMKVFQAKYGIFSLPEQTKAAVASVAELKSEALMREVELGILKNSLGEDNASVRVKQLEVDELNKKLRELKYGTNEWFDRRSAALFVPFKDLPDLGTQYLRLYRDLEIQNKLLEFIVPLYEQAKVEEQKNVPVVLVLDKAVPVERKDKPKRTIIVLTTSILTLLLNLFLVFLIEAFRSRETEQLGRAELWIDGMIRKIERRYKVQS